MSATRRANKALGAAAWELSVDKMRSALAAGANPLHRSWDEGHYHRLPVAALVTRSDAWKDDPGVDVDGMKVAALQLLGEHGGLDAHALTECMLEAMSKCGPTVVQQLLSAGANINDTSYAASWLHMAHRADVARLLLAAGADVTALDGGHSVLHSAVGESTEPAVFKLFADAGVDVDAVNSLGKTAFASAISASAGDAHVPALTALLELGADPFAGGCKDGNVLQYLVGRFVESVNVGFDRPLPARPCGAVVRLVARAAAWRRRRHMLLAVRCRYDRPAAVAPVAHAAGVTATAAAAGR